MKISFEKEGIFVGDSQGGSEQNVYNVIEVEKRLWFLPGEMLLGNKEFQKETRGLVSESEENELEEKVEEFVPEEKASKKR
ncbi:unnamed protein product [Arabis nemorensis]|uniref:Uncharacterized protein n=1 Tax=Arabis nemorensis TaxID=586526 RepID=A0A565CGV9_9BRAS|nr:unnamed protein product [Arabis nemorensis]